MNLSAQAHPNDRLTQRDSVEGNLANRKILFTAEFKVGSEEDTIRVWTMTGANLFWFPTSNCHSGDHKRDTSSEVSKCDSAGVYIPSELTTFHNTSKVFQWWYLIFESGAWGYFGTDRVQYGDFSGDMTFGIATNANYVGQLGLGFRNYQKTSLQSTLNESSFLEQLVRKGDISSNAYSFQLGINNASEGTLLLGAVDHRKYEGTLQKVKMVDMYTDGADSVLILLDGILGSDFSSELNIAVDIRMEYTTLSLPVGAFNELIAHLNAVRAYNKYLVPCDLLDLTDLVSFYFSGVEIQVPVRDLIFQNAYFGCEISIDERDKPPYLGQDILKSAYVVVNLDNKEVALAQASNSPDEKLEDIVSQIPLALAAPLYSYTEVAKKYYYSSTWWFSSLYNVSSRTSYSTNTASRSVDLGSTTYELFYPDATSMYDYYASTNHPKHGNSGPSTRYLPSLLLFSILLAF